MYIYIHIKTAKMIINMQTKNDNKYANILETYGANID